MASDAERIRNLALSDFIEPARRRGEASVTITARDVHDRLGLSAAHANVCQALAGRRLMQLARVPAPKMAGPMASSTTTFTYDLTVDGPTLAIDPGPYWLVGSSFGRKDDQTERFLSEGIWEVDGPSDSDQSHVRSMKPGERIAIKSTFVQRHGLPFDNRGLGVSAMRIKARGVITANPGTGARVEVAWEADPQPRDWYFFTNRQTIWRVEPDTNFSVALIQFAFEDVPQKLELFLADDYWSKMYGQGEGVRGPRFWIEKTLVSGRPDRLEGEHALGKALWSPQKSKDDRDIYSAMTKVREGDVVFHLTDNRAITDVSVVAGPLDESFTGVEGTEWANQPGYRIPLQEHVRLEPALPREEFLAAEPFSSQLKELVEGGAKGVFFNKRLELNQGAYLTEATPTLLAILNGAYQRYSGKDLPYAPSLDVGQATTPIEAYSLDDALKTLFLERGVAEDILLLWKAKKNVILQGPPGVGKSYAAQRLAYALMGLRDRDRLRFVQFHQSYSYEDFVEGFRPTETGFALKSGKFVEFCREAEGDPDRTYVFIIDEINRGNLSKIMGELMVLIEPDKRDAEWAMPLASGRAPFFVPDNVYLLGLMNTADRSLAVVDYALRRRFAFVDLQSNLASPKFRAQLIGAGVSNALVTKLIERINLLNAEIVSDVANLGPGFAIGHSFFCAGPAPGENETDWYSRVIRTEIAPLLREYWFDAPTKAEQWTEQLLAAH